MLHVTKHHSVEELKKAAKAEQRAKPRLRLQAVILALQGQSASTIAQALGTTERSVYSWLGRYNRDGLAALPDAPRPGRPLRLTPEQLECFRARLEAGPRPKDGVCSLRGVDLQRILQEEFGVTYSLNGVYGLLHHLGYSYLMPRPRHRHSDDQVQEDFKKRAAPFWQS